MRLRAYTKFLTPFYPQVRQTMNPETSWEPETSKPHTKTFVSCCGGWMSWSPRIRSEPGRSCMSRRHPCRGRNRRDPARTEAAVKDSRRDQGTWKKSPRDQITQRTCSCSPGGCHSDESTGGSKPHKTKCPLPLSNRPGPEEYPRIRFICVVSLFL